MKAPALVRRAGWNLGEQIISSLTNSILSILVAKSVSPESFGGFAIAFTVFALVIGGSRAISTSPLNIRFADVTPEESRRAAAAAAGNALVLGIVVGAVCVAAGLFFPGSLGEALIALGIVMPALLVQDAYRYIFFAAGRPSAAALASSFWAVTQIGAVTALLVFGLNAVGLLLLAWGVSAAGAALLSIRQAGAWPDPRRAVGWAREHVDLTGYKLATFATAQGSTQGAVLVIGAVASVVTVGSLRGTQILLGPTSIIALAALNFAIPELSRRRSTLGNRQMMLAALGITTFVSLLGVVWGGFFLLAPESVGIFLLAEQWPGTSEILFAAVVAQVFSAASIGPVAVIYALDRASATLAIQLILGILTFGGGVGGVLLGGALGAQWGFAVANAVVVPCWYFQLYRQLRRRGEGEHAELVEPDGTTVLPAREPPDRPIIGDFDMSQMSTMLMPRIDPRMVPPRPGPARPVPPRGGPRWSAPPQGPPPPGHPSRGCPPLGPVRQGPVPRGRPGSTPRSGPSWPPRPGGPGTLRDPWAPPQAPRPGQPPQWAPPQWAPAAPPRPVSRPAPHPATTGAAPHGNGTRTSDEADGAAHPSEDSPRPAPANGTGERPRPSPRPRDPAAAPPPDGTRRS